MSCSRKNDHQNQYTNTYQLLSNHHQPTTTIYDHQFELFSTLFTTILSDLGEKKIKENPKQTAKTPIKYGMQFTTIKKATSCDAIQFLIKLTTYINTQT